VFRRLNFGRVSLTADLNGDRIIWYIMFRKSGGILWRFLQAQE